MSKKSNSVVFMIIATLVNVLLLGFFLIAGVVLMTLIVNRFPDAGESLGPVLVIGIFAGAIFLSFFIYSRLVKWATAKFDLENKLDPLFTPKGRRKIGD